MAQEAPVMTGPPPPVADDQKPLRIRRGRVDSVDLYEIKDSELELFEKGSPAELNLNFAIFLLSIAFTSICALATATFANPQTEDIFTIAAIVSVIIGAFLLLSWYRSRTSLREVCSQIRRRIPGNVLPPSPDEAPDGDDVTPAG